MNQGTIKYGKFDLAYELRDIGDAIKQLSDPLVHEVLTWTARHFKSLFELGILEMSPLEALAYDAYAIKGRWTGKLKDERHDMNPYYTPERYQRFLKDLGNTSPVTHPEFSK